MIFRQITQHWGIRQFMIKYISNVNSFKLKCISACGKQNTGLLLLKNCKNNYRRYKFTVEIRPYDVLVERFRSPLAYLETGRFQLVYGLFEQKIRDVTIIWLNKNIVLELPWKLGSMKFILRPGEQSDAGHLVLWIGHNTDFLPQFLLRFLKINRTASVKGFRVKVKP